MSHLFAHRRLIACVVVGCIVGVAWPGVESLVSRALLGWNVVVWLYLVVVVFALVRAEEGHYKRVALEQAESAAAVLVIVLFTAYFTVSMIMRPFDKPFDKPEQTA